MAKRGKKPQEDPYPREKSRKEGRMKKCGGKEKNTEMHEYKQSQAVVIAIL